MNAQRPPQPRPKAKTPAERSEESLATQQQLKREAADRRDAAAKAKKDAPPAGGRS